MQLVAELLIKIVRFKFVNLRKQPVVIYRYKSFLKQHRRLQ